MDGMLGFLIAFSCTAPQDDLDGHINANHQTCEHTELLRQTFDPGILWDEYGIDEGVIVCTTNSTLLLSSLNKLQLFTNDFPCADIHELLSGDLLHEIIKGTFKDHLVAWVEDYLVLKHGRSEANKIMDDIDRR